MCILKAKTSFHNIFVRIWNALTDNYGNVLPVDWKSSHTRTLHLPTLNLSEKGVSMDQNFSLAGMLQHLSIKSFAWNACHYVFVVSFLLIDIDVAVYNRGIVIYLQIHCIYFTTNSYSYNPVKHLYEVARRGHQKVWIGVSSVYRWHQTPFPPVLRAKCDCASIRLFFECCNGMDERW